MLRQFPLLLSLTACLHGQDFLEPLVVTASRDEQKAKDVPYSVSSISQKEMEQNAVRTVPDALILTPGVLVQKTSYGHGSPFIRGLTGRQNLLMVDGVRINNSTFRGGPVQYWNTLDSMSIDHLELVKSQGSVLYGSDAMGGTLNVFSKSSDYSAHAEGEFYQGGAAYYQYRGSGQGSHIGRIELEGGIGGKLGVFFATSLKDFGDIEDDAVGRMRGTGYTEQDHELRVDYALNTDSALTFASSYVNQDDVSRWHRTINNPGWQHGSHFAAPGAYLADTYDQERALTYLRYHGENPEQNAAIARWSATLSWQNVRDSESQNRNPVSDDIRLSDIDLDTLGFALELESKIGPGSLIYGLDYYHDEVASRGTRIRNAGTKINELLPIADDSDYDLLGAFGWYVWKVNDHTEISTGARYTYAHATLGRFTDSAGTTRTDETQHWDSLVGSIRALHHLNDQWSVFGGISQAFRAPNLDDLTGNLTSLASTTSLGSTDLSPEKAITYELGLRHDSENLAVEAAVFHTRLSDQITSAPASMGSSTSISTNGADGYVQGIELQAAWKFHPRWELTCLGAWQEGSMKNPLYIGGPTVEEDMTRQLPLSGSVALKWTDESGKFWVEGRVLAAAKEDRISAADQAADNQRIPTGGTPGYVVASLNAGWQVTENLELTGGVLNLADTDYRYHGSGQNEPGLHGMLGAKVSW